MSATLTQNRQTAPPRAVESVKTIPLPVIFASIAMAALGLVSVYFTKELYYAILVLPLMLCAATQPPFLLMLIIALMPFQQSMLGEASSVNLSVSDMLTYLMWLPLPLILLTNGRRIRTGPAMIPIVLFLLAACISAANAWHDTNTIASLFRFTRMTLMPVLLFANARLSLATLRRAFLGYTLLADILSLFSIFAFATGGIGKAMYAAGMHKNSLGPTYGVAIAIILTFLFLDPEMTPKLRRYLFVSIGMNFIGIILALSRGGWIATGTGIILLLLLTRRFKLGAGLLLVFAPAALLIWKLLPDDATKYAGNVTSSSYQVAIRLDVIGSVMRMFYSSPIIGVGIDLAYKLEPHSLLVLTLGEMGIVGLSAFLFMCFAGFRTITIAYRLTKENPQTRLLTTLCFMVLTISLTHSMMDVYWRRGIGFFGWICVGVATQLIARAKQGEFLTAAQREKILAAQTPRPRRRDSDAAPAT